MTTGLVGPWLCQGLLKVITALVQEIFYGCVRFQCLILEGNYMNMIFEIEINNSLATVTLVRKDITKEKLP